MRLLTIGEKCLATCATWTVLFWYTMKTQRKIAGDVDRIPTALWLIFIVILLFDGMLWFLPAKSMCHEEKIGKNVVCFALYKLELYLSFLHTRFNHRRLRRKHIFECSIWGDNRAANDVEQYQYASNCTRTLLGSIATSSNSHRPNKKL